MPKPTEEELREIIHDLIEYEESENGIKELVDKTLKLLDEKSCFDCKFAKNLKNTKIRIQCLWVLTQRRKAPFWVDAIFNQLATQVPEVEESSANHCKAYKNK